MDKQKKTMEPQYQVHLDNYNKRGATKLGLHANTTWNEDPKHLLFSLSRYKFVSKMLDGQNNVCEIGCGDGTGARIVKQTVKNLAVTDFDAIFIEDIKSRHDPDWPLVAFVHDITEKPLPNVYDAIYSLDMMEHIKPEKESFAMRNILKSMNKKGVFILGIPSLASQKFAHPKSIEGHVNCKDGDEFKLELLKWFNNVFIFSMNDEVVHTGFFKMSHYLIAICCQPKIS